jgi:hypothetical protein
MYYTGSNLCAQIAAGSLVLRKNDTVGSLLEMFNAQRLRYCVKQSQFNNKADQSVLRLGYGLNGWD